MVLLLRSGSLDSPSVLLFLSNPTSSLSVNLTDYISDIGTTYLSGMFLLIPSRFPSSTFRIAPRVIFLKCKSDSP